MKKIIGFLVLLFFANFCVAQNWNVFNKNYRYNYKFDNSALISNVLFVTATTQVGTDTVYDMNLVALPCQSGCPTITATVSSSVITVPNNQIIVPFQPQFLQRKIKKYSNGSVLLYDTANFLIQPNCVLNQTWLFDNVTVKNATCVAVGTKTIFSIIDSVKTILIGLNDTLLLSKSFGIIQFPKPYGLNKYYRLVGIENAASYDQNSLYGLKVPNFWDMHNYNVGDIFYSTSQNCTYSNPNVYGNGYTNMFQITGKTVSANGYTYQTIGLGYNYYTINSSSCGQFPNTAVNISQLTYTSTTNTDPENLLYPNALIWGNNNFFNNLAVATTSVNLNTSFLPFNLAHFTMDSYNRFTKQAGPYGCNLQYQNNVLSTDTFPTLYHTVINNKDYLIPYQNYTNSGPMGTTRYICTEGIGLVIQNSDFFEHSGITCMKSAIKGGDTLYGPMPDYGTFTGVKSYTLQNNNNFFFPNPANAKIKVKQNCDTEIFDDAGKRVWFGSVKESDEIDISAFTQGLYLVRIKQDQQTVNQKLIISR